MRVRTLLNPFSCRQRFEKMPWQTIFPDAQEKLTAEIGFGTGSFLVHYGQRYPTHGIVGFEIRQRLVQQAQASIAAAKLTNVHPVEGNGQYGLEDMFEDASLDRIFIFHPDPWPKPRQQKRRVVTPAFIQLIERKLKPGGELFIATDVAELWDYMHEIVTTASQLTPASNEAFWEQDYKTRWQEMTQEQNRSRFYGTFAKVF